MDPRRNARREKARQAAKKALEQRRKKVEKNAASSDSKESEPSVICGIKKCNKGADKSNGGRSLGANKADMVWSKGQYETQKGRVKICKSCYRIWKKETKDEKEYY